MSAWDPWWVHGDYAETYHGAPTDEDGDLLSYGDDRLTEDEWEAFMEANQGPCAMGVGCDEAGVCYAAAMDEIERLDRQHGDGR